MPLLSTSVGSSVTRLCASGRSSQIATMPVLRLKMRRYSVWCSSPQGTRPDRMPASAVITGPRPRVNSKV